MRAPAIILLTLVFLLSGCEAGQMTAREIHYFTAAQSHPSGKKALVQGPTAKIYFSNSGATGYADVFLRTFVREGPDLHQLYVAFRDKNWVFFNHAYDNNGNELEFTEIDRKEVTAGITELFAAKLTDEYLESATSTRLEVKFVGKEGERTVYLRSQYVRGYLQKYKELTTAQ
jgi:hypothetical protein